MAAVAITPLAAAEPPLSQLAAAQERSPADNSRNVCLPEWRNETVLTGQCSLPGDR